MTTVEIPHDVAVDAIRDIQLVVARFNTLTHNGWHQTLAVHHAIARLAELGQYLEHLAGETLEDT